LNQNNLRHIDQHDIKKAAFDKPRARLGYPRPSSLVDLLMHSFRNF